MFASSAREGMIELSCLDVVIKRHMKVDVEQSKNRMCLATSRRHFHSVNGAALLPQARTWFAPPLLLAALFPHQLHIFAHVYCQFDTWDRTVYEPQLRSKALLFYDHGQSLTKTVNSAAFLRPKELKAPVSIKTSPPARTPEQCC